MYLTTTDIIPVTAGHCPLREHTSAGHGCSMEMSVSWKRTLVMKRQFVIQLHFWIGKFLTDLLFRLVGLLEYLRT